MYDPLPDRIFEDVSIDFFSYAGKDFLVYVDRKSRYPIVYKFNKLDTTTESVIKILRKTFSDVGVPRKLRSDGGPQFTFAQFRKFMQKWEIEHVKSSPHYPQANGHAEAAVKAMKKLIKTSTENGNTVTDEYHQALLEFRNTPKEGGLSPAQLVFGKPLRSHVPVHHSSFDPIWHEKSQEYDRKVAKNHLKSEQQYNQSARELKKLQIGTKVRLQNPIHKTWDKIGVIVAIGNNRKHMIKLPSGTTYWRNRRFIRERMDIDGTGEPEKVHGETSPASTETRRSPRLQARH